ncbi:LysR family transcriptional regulator [Acidisoma silvae]|uniref:LysR family transcriptional regulator n=1 Tax=Acidisoma silvae TaxID=2802396 RepID=A0A963YUZ3_9PROT|nr:LysR family transcriptional regulator [Acidisoma silvae]MCB8877555.1 LysR family transcriptional regulator [Acidisoma silvae]
MTLRQLEILRALIRHRTTVAAGHELGLSQPAVSNALKSMEMQLGFSLFERVNNRLHPTPEAMAIHDDAEAIFALHGQLATRLRGLKDSHSGRLAIAATPPLAYSVIPPVLHSFLKPRPDLRVYFDVRRYEGVIDAVLNQVAELGFVLGFLPDHRSITSQIVHESEMVCVCTPDHPLARRDAVSPDDLTHYPFIGLEAGTRLGQAVRGAFAAVGTPFRAEVEVRYCNTACALAAAGVGIAVVDAYSAQQPVIGSLVTRPFRPHTPVISYALWSQTRPLSRVARVFLDEVLQRQSAMA